MSIIPSIATSYLTHAYFTAIYLKFKGAVRNPFQLNLDVVDAVAVGVIETLRVNLVKDGLVKPGGVINPGVRLRGRRQPTVIFTIIHGMNFTREIQVLSKDFGFFRSPINWDDYIHTVSLNN